MVGDALENSFRRRLMTTALICFLIAAALVLTSMLSLRESGTLLAALTSIGGICFMCAGNWFLLRVRNAMEHRKGMTRKDPTCNLSTDP